ncbi:MAG TPA: Gfo/Idh/MocA family oxidoreductase [Chthonomonadaceae bacterium]|nr:Gfo/Idh/MocA family oxidoreductase [Chthonomonadaceae bacterium]
MKRFGRPARIAVVGTGWWATQTHIPALRDLPAAEIAALCDVDARKLRAAADAYGVDQTYADHREMLASERPDAVVVATTHATHFAVADDCLAAGAHVLIEKPMTLRAADARALTKRAAQAGLQIVTGYPANYRAHARVAAALLSSGALGPIQCVQTTFNSYCIDLLAGHDRTAQGVYPVHGPGDVYSRVEQSGGGHGHLQLTHAAGLLFFVTGLRAALVQARTARFGLPVDLVDTVLVEFEGGALGSVSGTSNAFVPEHRLVVGCADGGLEIDLFAGTTRIRRKGGEMESLPAAEERDLARAPVNNLVGVALGSELPISGHEPGWRAVELLEASYRSAAASGRATAVRELYA